MFDIELAPEATIGELTDTAATAAYLEGLCPKCKGKGRFIGWSGKVLGPCFACDGSGLSTPAPPPATLKPGECVKCLGTGAWRPGRECFACNGTGKAKAPAAETEITVEAIAKSFATAREHGIATPKLRLGAFLFSRAPDTGKNAGAIYVKTAAGHEYLGKVVAGKFVASMSCDAPTTAEIVAVAADPSSAAKAYGAKTKKCSCCGRTLTAGASVELGIGPICAENFGL
jgi:hypothetical protein